MTIVTRALIALALAFGLGCAPSDWIDRTLVTENMTGTWSGGWTGRSAEILFELEQQGSTVKGLMRLTAGTSYMTQMGVKSGPIEGTIAGDVFRFRQTNGDVEGEMTVSGDEMAGRASSSVGSRPFSLRRVDSSSPVGSPPR
jgi:hypothetical protein